MVPTHKPNSAFGKWLMKYRLLIIIVGLFILIPIAFTVALYLGDYLKYKNVYFGEDKATNFQSAEIVIEESTEHEVITLENSDIVISIKLRSVLLPEYIDDTGNYKFKLKHQTKTNTNISDLSVSLLLQAQWIDAKSTVKTLTPTTTYGSDQTIAFNHVLPRKPLPFVTVSSPDLYIQVKYTSKSVLGSVENHVIYYKVDTSKLTPYSVIDETNK